MPFAGYDAVRYRSQLRRQQADPTVTPVLYALRDESAHLADKCLYDRQLYLAVRNTINRSADSILSKLQR